MCAKPHFAEYFLANKALLEADYLEFYLPPQIISLPPPHLPSIPIPPLPIVLSPVSVRLRILWTL